MGLFDRLTVEDGLDVEFPDIGADPFEVTWQTKSIARHDLMMENYKVTSNRRLFKEEAKYEHIPEEEQTGYTEENGGFENEIERGRGSRKQIHQGWSETAYHGIFEFHQPIDGDDVSLDATFTDGQLVAITRND